MVGVSDRGKWLVADADWLINDKNCCIYLQNKISIDVEWLWFQSCKLNYTTG